MLLVKCCNLSCQKSFIKYCVIDLANAGVILAIDIICAEYILRYNDLPCVRWYCRSCMYHGRTDIFNVIGYCFSIIAYRYFGFRNIKILTSFRWRPCSLVVWAALWETRCVSVCCLSVVCSVWWENVESVCIKSAPSHHQAAKNKKNVSYEVTIR